MVTGLTSLMEKSEDFEILVVKLIELGYIPKGYSDKKRVVDLVRQAYSDYCYRPDSSHNLSPLPGRIVHKNGVAYFIHGIIHSVVGYSLSKKYRDCIRKATEGWHLLCEDGFRDDIFPEADIFGEVEGLGINKPRKIVATLPKAITLLFSIMYNKLRRVSPSIDLERVTTTSDLRHARLELFKWYLPEPLGINALLYINPHSLRIKRYVFEAEKAMGYASEKCINELHLMVGCAHEMPLEYLLNNPDTIKNFKRG